MRFPLDYDSGSAEVMKSYHRRMGSGFFEKYMNEPLVLDIGYRGDNPNAKPVVPHATGVELDFPGYDGLTLPFENNSVDTVFSSHCLEHIVAYQHVIRDWHRVLRVGGFIVCTVPHRDLYEKKSSPPSVFNPDHKRFYTLAKLAAEFEESLLPNTFRIRHLLENDNGFDYSIPPGQHSQGCYEIELVIEKIAPPAWRYETSALLTLQSTAIHPERACELPQVEDVIVRARRMRAELTSCIDGLSWQ